MQFLIGRYTILLLSVCDDSDHAHVLVRSKKQLTRQCKQSVDQQKPVVVVGLKRKADIEQERCQAVETYSVAKKARHFRTEKTGAAISS